MISVTCTCGGDFWVRDRLAGRPAICPACGTTLTVPALEAVKAAMTPATCSCGEVFWSSIWKPGKLTKCPICGGAVGHPRSEAQARPTSPAAARKDGTGPRTPATPPSGGHGPLSTGAGEVAPGSGTGAAAGRTPLIGRKDAPRAVALAAGALVLLAAGIFIGARTLGPAPKGEGDRPTASRAPEAVVGKAGDPPTPPGPAPAPLNPAAPVPLTLLVPAYFYPSGEGADAWNRLIESARRSPIVAIVNPATGPGSSPNPDYAAVVRRAKAAGVTVIGYVNTAYGKRLHAEVEADIDQWIRFYPEIGGIFFDAQSSDAEHASYYADLHGVARQKLPGGLVVTNPGTICAEEYLSKSASDVAVLFENKQGFEGFSLPSWANRYPPRRFAAVPYSVETAPQMREVVQQAVLKGIGYLYVTDGLGPNPWGRLPSYWGEELEAVARVNERKPF